MQWCTVESINVDAKTSRSGNNYGSTIVSLDVRKQYFYFYVSFLSLSVYVHQYTLEQFLTQRLLRKLKLSVYSIPFISIKRKVFELFITRSFSLQLQENFFNCASW